jgi:hypothetical protein
MIIMRRRSHAMRQSLVLLVAGGAALAALGCSDDPSLFLSGPPGAPAGQRLSASRVTIVVGDSVALGARVEDAAGNSVTGTAPTVASCNDAVATVGGSAADPLYSTSVWVRATGLGVSCLTVSGGGFTDTVRVTTGPSAVKIVGPNLAATTDTVQSGAVVPFTVIAFGKAGDTLPGTTEYEWTSSAAANLAVHRLTGEAAGKSPGTPSVRVRAPGGAMDQKSARVVAGIFNGTLSAATAAPGALITITRASDGPFFDGDTGVNLGQAAFVDSWSAGSVTFAVPATGATTAAVLGLTNMGPGQVAQNGSFTPSVAFADVHQPASAALGTAPAYNAVKSPSNWVYFTHSGYGTGAAARGVLQGAGGTQPDHYFLITTGASGGTVTLARLQWTNTGGAGTANASDFDIFICTVAGTGCTIAFSSSATEEVITTPKTLAPNTTYFVAGSNWSAFNNIHNLRLKVEGTGF